MDTGVSVRKRVIKIIRDVCVANTGFAKSTDACVKIISRINDEETSIQVLSGSIFSVESLSCKIALDVASPILKYRLHCGRK